MSKKKVLVIGGAGYIGSHLVTEFLESGYRVSVYDNLCTGRRENVPEGAEFFYGDINDPAALSEVIKKGFAAIFHLAAFKAAGESMTSPEKYARNNLNGTVNILNAATEAGIKNIIFSSTAAVYGTPQYLPIDEKHPLSPENFYGFTKYEIEKLLSWYERLRGIKHAALRYFNAAGYDTLGRCRGLETAPANLLPVVMEAAAGKREKIQVFGDDYDTPDGTGIRDYVHVNDLAEAHIKALDYLESEHRSCVVNLGTGKGYSVFEVIKSTEKITGRNIPYSVTERRNGDVATIYASYRKAEEVLGWRPSRSDLDTLVSSMWEIYKDI